MFLCVCLHIYGYLSLSASLSDCLSLSASAYMSARVCLYLCVPNLCASASVCVSAWVSASLCLPLSVSFASLSLTACLYLRRSICQRESASICVSVWLSASACVSLLLQADNMYVHLRMHLSVV